MVQRGTGRLIDFENVGIMFESGGVSGFDDCAAMVIGDEQVSLVCSNVWASTFKTVLLPTFAQRNRGL